MIYRLDSKMFQLIRSESAQTLFIVEIYLRDKTTTTIRSKTELFVREAADL